MSGISVHGTMIYIISALVRKMMIISLRELSQLYPSIMIFILANSKRAKWRDGAGRF